MKPSAILMGLAAGAAAALLVVGLILQSATAVALSLATPIPIFIASLGWGSLAGFVAAGAALAGTAALTGSLVNGAVLLLASMVVPAAIVGHLAGLARPSESAARSGTFPPPIAGPLGPSLDWYPLSRILFAIAALASVACLAVGWLVGYDAAAIEPGFVEALKAQTVGNPGLVADEDIQAFAGALVRMVPFVQPALLVLVLVAGLHLSGLLVRASGRLPRPRDDIPAGAALPKSAVAVFAAAVAAAFLPGATGTAAAVFAGTFGTAFTLVGLASFHRRIRGRPGRGLLLFSAYTAILFLSFSLIAATMLGLFETMRRPAGPAASRP